MREGTRTESLKAGAAQHPPSHAAAAGHLTACFLPAAENPCVGEVVREVIRRQKGYASCATASKVPVMECRGGCGPRCCRPTRSKRRKYVFQCTDGSSFVEEVERHLECGCRPCA